MSRMFVMLLGIILLPTILFVLQFFLCKQNSKVALVLPIIVACFFVVIGFYAVIISAIMFAIYFVIEALEKKKKEEQSELDKMNIQDL